MRDKTYSFKRLREDLVALGLRHRRGHDLRRAMFSLARTDGARADLRERCTHNPRRKERSIDAYSSFEWEPLWVEIAKLRIERCIPVVQIGPQGREPQMQQARPGGPVGLATPLCSSQCETA